MKKYTPVIALILTFILKNESYGAIRFYKNEANQFYLISDKCSELKEEIDHFKKWKKYTDPEVNLDSFENHEKSKENCKADENFEFSIEVTLIIPEIVKKLH